MKLQRITAVTSKETKEILRDPILVGVCLVLPAVMLFLFGYAVSLDVDDVRLGVIDYDKTPKSRALVDAFRNSGRFEIGPRLESETEAADALRRGAVKTVLIIPPGLYRDTVRREPAPVQILVDGTHSATALLAGNYARSIVFAQASPAIGQVQLKTRIWYNPSLRSISFFVPGLYGVILMSFPPLMTALGIVREKELGSVHQIYASPVTAAEYILGKLVPYGIIAFVQILALIGIGYVWFDVPVRGDVAFLLTASLIYVFCTVGIGLLISTVTRTQLAAMLAAFMVALMPSYLFSGFLFPIFTMPYLLQLFTRMFPTRYFVETSRDVVLKGAGAEELWGNVVVLVVYTAVVFMLASFTLKKKVA